MNETKLNKMARIYMCVSTVSVDYLCKNCFRDE